MQLKDKHIENDQWLEELLQTPPVCTLPDGFAETVAAKARRRFAWEQYFREFLVYLAAFIGLAGITAALAFLWLEADWQAWKQLLLSNLSLVISIHVIGLFVLFADKVLLQYFFFKSSVHLAR